MSTVLVGEISGVFWVIIAITLRCLFWRGKNYDYAFSKTNQFIENLRGKKEINAFFGFLATQDSSK